MPLNCSRTYVGARSGKGGLKAANGGILSSSNVCHLAKPQKKATRENQQGFRRHEMPVDFQTVQLNTDAASNWLMWSISRCIAEMPEMDSYAVRPQSHHDETCSSAGEFTCTDS